MLSKYSDIQSVFYNYFSLSLNNGKVSHAYLIESNGVSYAYDLAVDLAKFLVCDGIYDENICSLIDDNNYPGFLVVDSFGKEIKKEEILKIQKLFSLKSVDGKRMVYLIKDAALLNKHSSNSLLKFLEEPCEGIVAILLVENVNKVLDTISSRCQVVSLVKDDSFDFVNLVSFYYEDSMGSFDDFVAAEFNKFLNFYGSFEEKQTNVLVFDDVYYFSDKLKILLLFGLYFYFDVLNCLLGRDKKFYLPDNDVVLKVVDNNEINDIIYKIDVINKFLIDVNYNVNANLFVDNFVISLGGK